MAATDAQRNFAASTINYFNIDLKGGAGDTIKALVKATQQTTASGIAAAITNAKEITQEGKNKAVKDATDKLAVVTDTDLPAVEKSLEAAQKAVTDLTAKISTASKAAEKIVKSADKTAVTNPLGEASKAATKATTELDKINTDAMAKMTGTALKNAMTSAKLAITAASEAIDGGNEGAVAKLAIATTAANAIAGGASAGQTPTADKKAVIAAVSGATAAVGAAKDAIGGSSKGLVKDATTAGTDYTSYVSLQAAADAMEVGDHPITDAANAYNKACGGKIADIEKVTDAEVIACNTELLKGYGFINAILKNIPSKATGVLVKDASGDFFSGYAADLDKPANADKLKAAEAYFKIAVTVAGSEPFATGDAIPEPKDYTNHAKHVEHTLLQLNAISYALLDDTKCGSANKADLSDCYKVHAADLKAIYAVGATDEMNIDVSAKYLFDDAFKGNTELPTIDM